MNRPVPTPGESFGQFDLDDALMALAVPVAVADADLTALRVRALSRRSGRIMPRRRKLIVTATVIGACAVAGGVGAAAAGVFDDQARTAFSDASNSAFPEMPHYRVDRSSVRERVTSATPDGGSAALYTASAVDDGGREAGCTALLLTDPGVTPPGKPYRPSGVCNPEIGSGSDLTTGEDGWQWQSRKTGIRYSLVSGHTDPRAVTATFTSLTGDSYTVPVRDGYLIAFHADKTPKFPYNGMSITDSAGHTTRLSVPTTQGAG